GRRVNRGNAEAVADGAVRRRSGALAQDRGVERPRVGDDIVDRQEIPREIELLDQRQLVFELLDHLLWNSIAPALTSPRPGEMLEMLLRRSALGHGLTRIFVAQLVEAEVKRIGEFARGSDRMRPWLEQPHHLHRR